jgi:hypothetical protein
LEWWVSIVLLGAFIGYIVCSISDTHYTQLTKKGD